MTEKHPFFLCPGQWLGEGTIGFSASDEELKFYTRWSVSNVGKLSLGKKMSAARKKWKC